MFSGVKGSQDREIKLDGISNKPIGGTAKRGFDIAFALIAISTSLFLFLIVAVLIKSLSPGPLFFFHERVGYKGKRFKCIKFRTMAMDADERLEHHLKSNPAALKEFAEMRKLRSDPRIVPGIGHVLRKTSLDELPQFFNVLIGDMSIVGPRPITEEEMPLYGMTQSAYLRARPGITGLWQVSGRSTLPFSARATIDRHYVYNWSMIRDLKIIGRTLGVLFSSKGAC